MGHLLPLQLGARSDFVLGLVWRPWRWAGVIIALLHSIEGGGTNRNPMQNQELSLYLVPI